MAKSFTNIAILKLIEQGRLQMDDDIRPYLPGVDIKDTFAAPITIAHLLSHTGGLEETYTEILALDGAEPPAMQDVGARFRQT